MYRCRNLNNRIAPFLIHKLKLLFFQPIKLLLIIYQVMNKKDDMKLKRIALLLEFVQVYHMFCNVILQGYNKS